MEVSSVAPASLSQPEQRTPLADQAKGMHRRTVMKDVVGPALTEFLYPIYEPSFSTDETDRIPSDSAFPDLRDLVWGIEGIAKDRLAARIDDGLAEYIDFEALKHAREDLFFNFGEIVKGADFKDNLEDSINSAVMIPIVAAVDILRLESGDQPGSPSAVLDGPFSPQAIIDIMRRDSFDRILSRLAKGPNDFITSYLSDPQEAFSLWASPKPNESRKADAFFGFRKGYGEYKDRKRLTIWDAYRMEDGRVADLGDGFFRSAKEQRSEIDRRGAMVFSRGPHRGEDSSGCPVRHTFDGHSGSLITANKDFIIAALEIAGQKADQAESDRLLAESAELTNPKPELSTSRLRRLGNWLVRRNQVAESAD